MATQKPISTISYNSEAFLREKLDEWYQAHIIQAYMYICHQGEDGDKDHIHVRIEPNKRIDSMELTELLREYPLGNSCKPLGCRPWRSSKEEDWFLYAVHDKDYLKLKYSGGEKGEKIPYSWEDIVVPEYYDVETAFIRARASLKHSTASIAKSLLSGSSGSKLVQEGENPFVVASMLRVMQASEFERVSRELADARDLISMLESAIKNKGLSLEYDDSGFPYII